MNRTLVFGLSLLFLLLCMVSPRFSPIAIKASDDCPVHNLNSGLNYTTIQDAIDANETLDGHTIIVDAGTYYEHVVVNKSLSIFGENKENTLIDGNKTGPVILVVANEVNLTEFTIRAGQNSHPICNVFLENVSKCNIHGNVMINSFYGVSLTESNGNSVYENFATNVSIGICGVRSDWNSVFRNEFVANSFAGINFHLCSFNNVTENLISGNSMGMRLLDGANNNTIHHNNFVNNTVQVYIQFSYNNIWDDGYPSGGNYWSDYLTIYPNATEIDDSGTGDTPYTIDANNIDHYPLMTQHPVIPELPSFLILFLFVIVILVAAIVYRRKRIATK